MIDLWQQSEAIPASYPATPSGLSEDAQALDADMIWQRIESYTAHRFSEREIVWTIEGLKDDEWRAPIVPLVSHTAEKWEDSAWVSATLDTGPLGFCLPSDGTFKITAQVGAAPTPVAVDEAFRRLAEYSADIGDYGARKGEAGATRTVFDVGQLNFQMERYATWAARAIQLSGAADLLRPYRRA